MPTTWLAMHCAILNVISLNVTVVLQNRKCLLFANMVIVPQKVRQLSKSHGAAASRSKI